MIPNKLIYGILIACGTLLAAYGVVSLVFEIMENTGFMDEAYGEASEKRERTKLLISVCANIIGIQIFRKRNHYNIQRGIALTTVLAGIAWAIYFKDSLFFLDQ